ncbi:hypothetical protein ACQ4M3_00870 [Leptolyngbya sp. AN03gr2]|uniref:hypothetical protein n=1 Tax=unclassified Leptolyngbya TaxID=2650499 RepID=UPI003D31F499
MRSDSEHYRDDERHTEGFEYLRLNATQPNEKIYFILLHRQLSEIGYHRSLSITAIPFCMISRDRLYPVQWQPKTWTAEIRFDLNQVDFNEAGRIEVIDDLRNRGLGSAMFSDLIEWAQNYDIPFTVKRLHLSANDAIDNKSRDLRNHFYRKFGFQLHFTDAEEREGSASAANVLELHQYRNSHKVEKMSQWQFLRAFSDVTVAISAEADLIKRENDRLLWENSALRRAKRWLYLGIVVAISIAVWAVSRC